MSFFQRVSNNVAEINASVDKLDQLASASNTFDSSIWGGNQSVSSNSSDSIFAQSGVSNQTQSLRLVEYTVKKGDTLNNIAKKYNVKLSELLEYNPQIKNANLIYINQKIFIPQPLVAHDSVRAAETKKSQKTEPVQNKETPKTSEDKAVTTYTVQKGDTLAKIAQKQGVTLAALIDANPQIKNVNLINVNQKINIPTKEGTEVTPAKTEEKKSWFARLIDKIKSFFGIGKSDKAKDADTKVSTDKVDKTNRVHSKLTMDDLKNGKLSQKDSTETYTTYTVKKGDTLRSLIRDNIGLSEKALKDANPDVNFKKLKAGQEIKLPQVKTLEDAYDYETSSELLQTAKNHIAQGTDKDYCARAVKSILIKDGILDYRPDCEHAYQMEEDLDNCDALQKIYVEREDIKNLPAGCVVIWGNVETAEDKANEKSQYAPFRKSGHIFITAGDGKEISDHAGRIITHQTHYAVYVPKKLTTEEREQKAIDARQDYKDSLIKTGEKQQKYLNAYINWAKAAIDDNNVSQDSLKRLEALLIEVPENNKSASVKDLVAKCEELLPQVQAKIK